MHYWHLVICRALAAGDKFFDSLDLMRLRYEQRLFLHAFDLYVKSNPICIIFLVHHKLRNSDRLPVVSVGDLFEKEMVDLDILLARSRPHLLSYKIKSIRYIRSLIISYFMALLFRGFTKFNFTHHPFEWILPLQVSWKSTINVSYLIFSNE